MTPTQVKTLLDSGVLQAFAEGKEIQFQIGPKEWRTLNYGIEDIAENVSPAWDQYKWRVKPEKKTGWINIYPNGFAGFVYSTQVKCMQEHNWNTRIACIKITYEEGEGL